MDQKLSIALYARVSSQRQADELTICSQVAALRERMEKDEFETRMSRAKQRLTREQQEQAQHERDVTDAQELQFVISQLETFAEQIAAGLEQTDLAARRKLLRLLIKCIEVDNDEVRIVYKVQAPPFVLSPARGNLQDCLKCRSTAQGCPARRATLGYEFYPCFIRG